jgi:hypothetical protein
MALHLKSTLAYVATHCDLFYFCMLNVLHFYHGIIQYKQLTINYFNYFQYMKLYVNRHFECYIPYSNLVCFYLKKINIILRIKKNQLWDRNELCN